MLIKYKPFKFYFQLLFKCIFSVIIISSCENLKTEKMVKFTENSPYEIFFNQLKISQLTDTILVQNKTKIFGCGTGYVMYHEDLKESGLSKFYEKYGTVLDNQELLKVFEKNNNLKILWIERGNEGELFQLEDSVLHNNKKLEIRLMSEKAFLVFDETPKSLDSLNITVTIEFSNTNKILLKSFDLSQNKYWKIDKQTEQEFKKDL